jgi:hypothetical protein
MGPLIAGARFLTFNSDYRAYFDETNPERIAYEQMQATYAKADGILIALVPRDGDVFTHRNLGAVTELTKKAWQTPYSRRVDSLSNFQYSHANGDELIVRDLVQAPQQLDNRALDELRRIALAEPILVDRLVASDSGAAGVYITVELPGKNSNEVLEAAHFARQLAKEVEQAYPDLEAYVTGDVMLNAAFPEASQADMTTLLPAAFVAILCLIALFSRQIAGTLVILLVIALSVGATFGIGGWLGMQLNPASSGAAIIILTLAVADGVHILTGWRQRLVAGLNSRDAMYESLDANFNAVFLTSLTTAIGFLTLNFSESPPFVHLGNLSALGAGLAFLLSVTFLPALLTLLPRAGVSPTSGNPVHFMAWLSEFVIARRRSLLWVLGPLVVALIVFIPRNELDDTFVEYFDTSTPFRSDTDAVTEHLSGIYTLDFELDSGEASGVATPSFLRTLEAFSQWLREQPEVVNVNSVAEIFKRLNRNMHGDDPAWHRLPEARDLAAQYLLLYEMSLPYGLDLNDRIDIDKRATRVTVTLQTLSSNQMLAFERRARAWLKTRAPDLGIEAASPTLMFAHIGERQIRAMLNGTAWSLTLVVLTLILAMGSLRYGLISLVPNLVPAATAFGLWGLFVGEMGLGLSVVAAMTLGIVVDDTVHLMGRYMQARRQQGLAPDDAIRFAFRSTGVALWITSLALVSGFSILALSSFQLNSDLGLLVAVIIMTALIADFLLLPALLMTLDRDKTPQLIEQTSLESSRLG